MRGLASVRTMSQTAPADEATGLDIWATRRYLGTLERRPVTIVRMTKTYYVGKDGQRWLRSPTDPARVGLASGWPDKPSTWRLTRSSIIDVETGF